LLNILEKSVEKSKASAIEFCGFFIQSTHHKLFIKYVSFVYSPFIIRKKLIFRSFKYSPPSLIAHSE
jgi:hypothetical protein